jgi:formyl-CoA transferase
MLQTVFLPDGSPLLVPGIVPKLSRTPGGLWRAAPALGADTAAVLGSLGTRPTPDRG